MEFLFLFTDTQLVNQLQSQIFLAQKAHLLTTMTFTPLVQGFLPIMFQGACPQCFLCAPGGILKDFLPSNLHRKVSGDVCQCLGLCWPYCELLGEGLTGWVGGVDS